jgi:hypothetical protein
MDDILEKLKGGDRRSVGRASEVVAQVLADPALFETVFGGMTHPDPLIRMRSADVAEKVTAHHPELLVPYKRRLLEQVAPIEQQEVRWHVAQMIPRLEWNPQERQQAGEILTSYLQDKSRIVQTMSLQALADLVAQDDTLRPTVIALLEEHARTGSPATKSRSKRLLKQLGSAK